MNCDKVRRNLPLLAGGELDSKTAGPLREHVTTCLGCFREYQEYLEIRENLAELRERPEISPVLAGLPADVMRRLREDPDGPAAAVRFMPLRKIGFLAAAAVIIVSLGAAFFLDGFSDPSSDPFSGDPDYVGADQEPGKETGNGKGEFPKRPGSLGETGTGTGEGDLDFRMIPLTPEELPSVQPASYRRGF